MRNDKSRPALVRAGPFAQYSGSRLLGRVLAVDPRAFEFLIIGRDDDAAAVAALPADDLVRLAAPLAAGFPLVGPAVVGIGRLAVLLVPEEHLAEAVTQDAHVHRRERGGAEFRRRERLALS